MAVEAMRESGVADAEGFYLSMIRVLERRRLENVRVIRRLDVAFTVMLCGMLVAMCGLAGAASVG
jgi:hypothetical protein